MVAVLGVIVIVYVATEVSRAIKPAASADEDTSVKPLWAIVAIRGAIKRSNVVVSVRA
jgi:hypothetical protein